MVYKISDAWDAWMQTRPVNWITTTTAARSKDKEINKKENEASLQSQFELVIMLGDLRYANVHEKGKEVVPSVQSTLVGAASNGWIPTHPPYEEDWF